MGISEFCRLTPNTYTYLGLEDAEMCIRDRYNLSYIGLSYPAKDAAVLKQVECLIKCAGFWKLVKRR